MTETVAPVRCLLDAALTRPTGYPVVAPAALPSRDELLAAIAGHLTDTPALIGWARELGDLHASLIPRTVDPWQRANGFDEHAVHAEIADHIAEINSWAVFHLPRNPVARMHTHSLGEVISHVAKTYAEAWWTVLHTATKASTDGDDEELRHEAWFHLGEVWEGYAQLVEDMKSRRVQLPLGWRGVPRTPPSTT
ncbi:hypothetical protein [Nocardia sp. NBC_01009]|uniref:hypothetical protein n=1 Tax=Nocardia sp. NBC_01009 TaxID=2975996 RepID=UPI00386780AD|nr:hypothetical protein OHA42_17395 [Nocardia sp. NBC_01009]